WNGSVFGGRLPADLPLVWNPRLLSTAGQVVDDGSANRLKSGPDERIPVRLELSVKVVDNIERLRHTLAHEMCHVAAWGIDKEFNPHHGPAFWRWAGLVTEALPEISVTRLHSFATFAPFRWQCTSAACGKTYSRHRASIDPARHACGVCRSRLRALGKFDRSGNRVAQALSPGAAAITAAAGAGVATPQQPHAYRQFVKANFAGVKSAQPPGTPHGAVMKALSAQWSTVKQLRKDEAAAAAGQGQQQQQGQQPSPSRVGGAVGKAL
ncbi:hypothetical protein FOA52_000782, partial [Chlamydomonas sp. UWO 241]